MTKDRIRFGRYELIERLATGGMAELYRAVLTGPSGFSKTVAIKILPELGCNERFRDMFLHEGRVMAALTHRNLVQVFELGEVEGELYISLELVTGCDLAEAVAQNMRTGRFVDPALAVFIAREVCRGLEYVHGLTDDQGRPQHIVHRDVSPQNILLSDHGDVKLGDFGIAKSGVLEDSVKRRNIKGKLEYPAEQARGDEVGPASDVYAVGLTLYEMLTSRRYIQGEDVLALVDAAAQPVWRPIREINPAVPEFMRNVVRRALRAEPEERYPSATSFANTLEHLLQEAPWMPTNSDVADLVEQTRRLRAVDTRGRLPPSAATPAWGGASAAGQARSPTPLEGDKPRTLALSDAERRPTDRSRLRGGMLILLMIGTVLLAGVLLAIWIATSEPEQDRLPRAPEYVYVANSSVAKPAPALVDAGSAPTTRPESEEIKVNTPESADAGSAPMAEPAPKKRPVKRKRRREKRKKLKRKKKTESARMPPKPPVETGREVASTTIKKEVPAEPPVDLEELDRQLARQRQRLQKRGVRTRDNPVIDQLIGRVQRQIAQHKGEAAQHSLQVLDEAVDRMSIDRAFVEKKMKRLQLLLAKKNRQAEFSTATKKILSHVLNSRFGEANQAMNRIFDRLE